MILSNKEGATNKKVAKVVTMKIENLVNEKGNMVCEIRPASMGFEKVVVLGKDWDYSRTTTKHLGNFLKQNNLEYLAGAKNIREALERGYARHNESIAVWLDDTL